MTADPWPVYCGRPPCTNPAEWLVETPGRRGTAGARAVVCCDACLPAGKRWVEAAGRGPPVMTALHPDEPPTLF